MTDTEIIKALECCIIKQNCTDCPQRGNKNCLETAIEGVLDLVDRQKAEIDKFKNRQKPTAASGYKLENGKVVFFTNVLGGCRIEKENLEEVVETLNELLQECYSKDEIAFALKRNGR